MAKTDRDAVVTMASAAQVLLASLPLLVAGILLVVFLWPATRAMPVAWATAVLVGWFVWGMTVEWLVGASIVGVMTALSILWIVFGALVLLYTLMQAGAFDVINRGFAEISEDRRIQVILLGFFLATFIEGAAGFGTPAAVVAPLLLGLGFPALAAVVAAIIGHIIAVTYGAVGTPIIIGINEPLASVGSTREAIVAEYGEVGVFAQEVAAWAATYHALVGFMMPLFAVGMVVYFFGEERSIQPALSVAPLAIFAGVSFAIPYWIAAWFFTAEFPSLVGSLVGGSITVAALRAGFFLPDDEWEFPDRSDWPDHWVGDVEPGEVDLSTVDEENEDISLFQAWLPYVALVVLLVVTRVVDPIATFLGTTLVIEWTNILGTGLEAAIDWLFLPGTWLIVSALIAIPLYGMSRKEVTDAWAEAGEKLVSPFIALIFAVAMVQIMLQSGEFPESAVDLGMITLLADATANTFGGAFPAVAALIGALGAAVAGSNTVSNITFGVFQFEAATRIGVSREIVVGAQAVGGAIGNLVAIHNVVAALATVGLVGQEGRVIRLNLIPLVYYAVGVGILAMLFTYVIFPGVW